MREEFGNPLLWHAHNLVLETAVETGLPGAALLLLLIFATAYRGWRIAGSADTALAIYGTALVSVVAGMIVRNMTDTLLARQNALLYWGIVGVLFALDAARSASKLNSTLRADLRQPTR